MSCKPTLVAASALAALLIVVGGAPVLEAQPPPPPNALPQKHALLIGVNKYLATLEVPDLTYAENDVVSLQMALEAQDYKVTPLKAQDAKRESVISYLEQEARVLRPQDTFLLYIAGHGVKSNNHVYWLAFDSGLSFLSASAIRLTHLMDYVRDIKAEHKIVLLDHCYSGELIADVNPAAPAAGPPPVAPGPTPPAGTTLDTTISAVTPQPTTVPRAGSGVRLSGARNVDPSETLGEIMGTLPGSLLIAASRGAAYEMQQFQHGIFTRVLLDALTTRNADTSPADGNLSADELKIYVRNQVEQISKQLNLAQTPLEDVRGSLSGWLIATGLRATGAQDADRQITHIKDVLRTWQQQGRLTTLERIKCYEVLDHWHDAVQRNVDERTLADFALLQTIREVVGNETADVGARVAVLKEDLNARGGGQ